MWLINFKLDNVNYYLQKNIKEVKDVHLRFTPEIIPIQAFTSMITIKGLLKRFRSSKERSIQFYVIDKHSPYSQNFILEGIEEEYELVISKFKFLNTKKDIIFIDGLCTYQNIDFEKGNWFSTCYKCGMLIDGDTKITSHTNKNMFGSCCPLCHEQITGKKCKQKFPDEFIKEWILHKLKKETLCG